MSSTGVVFLVAAVVALTLAIDLDESFIDLLISEGDYAAAPVRRFARQASTTSPPGFPLPDDFRGHMKKMSCCKSGSVMNMFKEKEVFQECFSELRNKINFTYDPLVLNLNSCSKENNIKMIKVCSVECAAVKLKLFKEDGKPETETVKKLLKEQVFTEDWMKRIADRTIDTCLKSINNTLLSTPDTGNLKCHTSVIELKHCLRIQIDLNCPEADRKTEIRIPVTEPPAVRFDQQTTLDFASEVTVLSIHNRDPVDIYRPVWTS